MLGPREGEHPSPPTPNPYTRTCRQPASVRPYPPPDKPTDRHTPRGRHGSANAALPFPPSNAECRPNREAAPYNEILREAMRSAPCSYFPPRGRFSSARNRSTGAALISSPESMRSKPWSKPSSTSRKSGSRAASRGVRLPSAGILSSSQRS